MKTEIIKAKNDFFASCPGGLEELLLNEVEALEPKNTNIVKGGVEFNCLPEVALELMLSTRIASRVYRKLYQFDIKTEKDLYFNAKEIKWKSIFDLGQTFKINVVQTRSPDGKKKSQFENTMFLAQKLKDAICDRFREDCDDQRPDVEKNHPDATIIMHIQPQDNEFANKETVNLLIDMSGRPLSQRGYKVAEFQAPLKENLAAGLVLLSGYDGEENFVDAMCGSGTILIEALLIAGDIPPTFLNLSWFTSRNKFWDFEHHLWFESSEYLMDKFDDLINKYLDKTEAGFQKLDERNVSLIGNDIDSTAIRATLDNLRKAGLQKYVELDIGNALDLKATADKGIVIVNPPYGERLGKDDDLAHLYHEFGETLKHQFKGYRAYILTGNIPLLKKISLRTSKKLIVYNGNIESRLAEYELH